jgi:single-strand DNA-binding protein
MASYNKIILAGNIGKDCETRDVNDVKVMSFTLAVSEKWCDKDGNDQERTDWFTVDYFSKSDALKDYLKKGTPVLVEGRMVSRDYNDKDGNKRTAWSVRVERLQLLGSKK